VARASSYANGASEYFERFEDKRMEYQVLQDSENKDRWLAQAINFECEGEIYTVLFLGYDAEERAREYADWKNSSQVKERQAA
jgi:hypothetical protein